MHVGLTFDEIAKALGKDEVWVAAAFYGQVSDLELMYAPIPDPAIPSGQIHRGGVTKGV